MTSESVAPVRLLTCIWQHPIEINKVASLPAVMPALEASTTALGSEVEAEEPGTSGRGAQQSKGTCGSKVRASCGCSPARTWARTEVRRLYPCALARLGSRLPVH